MSPVVHALPSSQGVLLGLIGFEHLPLAGSHVPAVWHWSMAVHITAIPGVQTPLRHASPVPVQELLSLQGVPSVASGLEHVPVLGLQVPAVWQAVGVGHVTAVPAMQVPLWQMSPVVHALLSLHVVPFALVGLEQTPVLVLQVPALWHWSLAVHVTGVPTQVPLWQVSPVVHALLSLHAVPVCVVHVKVAVEHTEHEGHADPIFCHCPLESHVCGCGPLHCLLPGRHTPVHAPLPVLQTKGHLAPMSCHCPFASHDCG